MGERPDQVLALDIDTATVRGIVLGGGSSAVAGGYAQLGFDQTTGPASVAARIASALDAKAALPVLVTAVESLGESAVAEMVAAVKASGFAAVSVVSRDESMRRANPGGGDPDKLVDCDIAHGLLTSHAGLTLKDLAPVVGAGLGVLGLGASLTSHDDEPLAEPLAVWQPGDDVPQAASTGQTVDASDTPALADDDPFTVSATIVGAGAATVGVAAAAFADDDDLTVARTDDSAFDVDHTVVMDKGVTNAAVIDGEAATLPEQPPKSAFDDFDEDPTIPPEEPESEADVFARPMSAGVASAAGVRAGSVSPESVAADAEFDAALEPFAPGDVIDIGGEKRPKVPLVALLVAAAVIAAIVVFFFVARGSSSDVDVAVATDPTAPATAVQAEPTVIPPTTEPTSEPATAAVAQPDPTAEPDPEPTPEPAPDPEPTTEPAPDPEPTVDPLAGLPPLSELPERGAIFRPPTLFLEGPVQTQEEADELYARAIAVVGPDNVVNDYVVRPDAPAALDGNVRVEQAVLFQTGSATIVQDFIPTLELGVAVMNLNPQVIMVVEGHTDSVGGEQVNQALSERRAEAVVEYLITRGVDPDRLQAVGLGETSPIASNETAEGRQVNRRIEVELLDLLAG